MPWRSDCCSPIRCSGLEGVHSSEALVCRGGLRPDSEDCEWCGSGADHALEPAGVLARSSTSGPCIRPADVEVLKTVARQRLHAKQDSFDYDDGRVGAAEAPIVGSRARHLWEMLTTAYRVLRSDRACPDDGVLPACVGAGRGAGQQARLDPGCWPSSGSSRRRIPRSSGGYRLHATGQWRQALAAAYAGHVGLGPATLVLYERDDTVLRD